jgi:MFS family permease
LAIALVFIVGMAGTTLPTPLYPLYQQQLDLSQLMVTVIFATYAFAVLAALIATGPWSDQVGRRPVLAGALTTGMISALLFLTGDSLGWLLLARVFSGLSAGLFTATATVMIIELAPGDRKARAAMVAACANMGGLGLGPLLAGVVSQYLPWPLHFVYGVNLALLVVCCFIVWRCPETVDPPAHPRLQRQRLGLPPSVRSTFGPAAIACVAAFALLALLTSLEPAIVSEVTGVTNRAAIGGLVFMVFAASLAGQVLQGRLTEGASLPLSCMALVAGAGLLAVSMTVGSMTILLCGAVVAGLGQGGIFAASITAVTGVSPNDRKAEVAALLFVVIYLSVALPVLGLGVAVELSGLRTAGIAFAVLVLLFSTGALFALWRRRKRASVKSRSCRAHIATRSS